MSQYDRPPHPATKIMAFIALLIGLGIAMEGFNQAHSYFAPTTANASATTPSSVTDGRAHTQR
jgi:hypothetical protein